MSLPPHDSEGKGSHSLQFPTHETAPNIPNVVMETALVLYRSPSSSAEEVAAFDSANQETSASATPATRSTSCSRDSNDQPETKSEMHQHQSLTSATADQEEASTENDSVKVESLSRLKQSHVQNPASTDYNPKSYGQNWTQSFSQRAIHTASNSSANHGHSGSFKLGKDDDGELSSDADLPDDAGEYERNAALEPMNPPKKPASRPRVPRAKNAREFFARMREKESQKDAPQAKPRKVHKDGQTSIGALLSTSVGDMPSSMAPAMPSLNATTVQEQIAAFRAQIPEGRDNRRSKTQLRDLQQARRSFGYGRVKAEGGEFRIKSMNHTLLPYQMTAVEWMFGRELKEQTPLGGIVADAMGMGKTIVSLTCISEILPTKEELQEFSPATLVVVPNQAAAVQWRNEVRKHCSPEISEGTRLYKMSGNTTVQDLKRSTIVIVTYNEILRHFPSSKFIQGLNQRYGEDELTIAEEIDKMKKDIYKVQWYRVILDEAHMIKNRNSTTSIACAELEAKNRWALTGTPLANDPDELFPYLRYLRCSYADKYSHFKKVYFKGGFPTSEYENLVSALMYRRTQEDTFLGHKILDIPPGSDEVIWVPLSLEELSFMEAILLHYGKSGYETDASVNGKCQDEESEDEVEEDEDEYDIVYEDKQHTCRRGNGRVIRLRQAVSHPFTLEKMLREDMSLKQLQSLRHELSSHGGKRDTIDQIIAHVEKSEKLAPYLAGLQFLKTLAQDKPIFGGRFRMDRLMDLTENESQVRNVECKLCNKAKPPVEPIRSVQCEHIFCDTCLVKAVQRHRAHGKTLICPHDECGCELDTGEDIATLQSMAKALKDDPSSKEPGSDSNGVIVARDLSTNSFILDTCLSRGAAHIPPSTKCNVAMAVVLSWLREHPEDKIIIFFQFVSPAKVFGCMLEELGYKFVYFFGPLTEAQKKNALKSFEEDAKVRILLSSLRCGGQSLNLTHANRVILVDPWWNTTAEKQAWARVHRMGQQKNCHFVKIMTQGSIDVSISELQIRKARRIAHALQDDGHPVACLTQEQMERMFENVDVKPQKRKVSEQTSQRKRVR